MISVSVDSDIDRATRRLTRIQKRQIPFAAALALARTAYVTRQFIVRKVYPSSFPTIRNKRFPHVAFRYKPRKVSKRKLEVFVYDRLDRKFLKNQAFGATKTPYRGAYLKVPRRGDESVYTPTGRGKKFNRTFVTEGKFGTPVIYQRAAGKRKGKTSRRFLFGLQRSVSVDKRFYFFEKGGRAARRAFPKAFKRGLARALATANR